MRNRVLKDWVKKILVCLVVLFPCTRALAVDFSDDLGKIDESQKVSFSFSMGLNSESDLDRFLEELYSPGHSNYHQFLSPEQFRNRYSPTPEQMNRLKDFLALKGIEIRSVSANSLLVHARASVGAINSLVGTELHQYRDATGKVFQATPSPVQVSDELGELQVRHIHGLNTNLKARFHDSGSYGNDVVGGLKPSDFKSIYHIPSSLDGSGQTLALVEFGGFLGSDVDAYASTFGLPAFVETILVGGYNGGISPSSEGEVALDIQLMVGMAPNAKILVYEGTDMLSILNQIASDNLAQSISSSWTMEGNVENIYSLAQSEATVLKQMAAQGQSFFVSSGDNGALNGGQAYVNTSDVSDLGTQPYATVVGGTNLRFDYGSHAVVEELAWEGSGGGASPFFTLPSWQNKSLSASALGSEAMRNVPDVALNADPYSGYFIYLNGAPAIYGGTSASAPLWAAFTALVNQKRQSLGKGPVGFLNPALYAIGESSDYNLNFGDIVSGNNGFYPAIKGFDDATGWGSFNGENLIATLSGIPLPTAGSGVSPIVSSANRSSVSSGAWMLAGVALSWFLGR